MIRFSARRILGILDAKDVANGMFNERSTALLPQVRRGNPITSVEMRFRRGDATAWRRARTLLSALDCRARAALPNRSPNPNDFLFPVARLSSDTFLREIRSPLESRREKRFNSCRGRISTPRACALSLKRVISSREIRRGNRASATSRRPGCGKISARD